MSPVVRVVAGPAEADAARAEPGWPQLPRRQQLSLAELVAAARLAGDVPLPMRTDGTAADDRLAERLAGTPDSRADELITSQLARADDDGPDGAHAALAHRGLLDGDRLEPGATAALQTLAGGPVGAVLDVSVTRRAGTLRLRSWFGVRRGLVAQLSTGDGLDHELAWFDPRLWVSQLARAVTVDPWVPEPAPMVLPDHVSLPSELLVGNEKAHRDHRTDLLPAMVAAHRGRVRLGDGRAAAPADAAEALSLLRTLGGACRGRLRLLTTRRDRTGPPGVASWLLFDDGWHELRPGRGATSVLRARDPRDLGIVSWPLVASATEAA